MKYVIYNDLLYVRSKWKIFLIFLSIPCVFSLFLHFVLNIDFSNLNVELFYTNIGSNNNINSIIEYSMLAIIISFFSFIITKIFTKDFDFGRENIFLRISQNKWIIYKIISLLIIILIIEFLMISAISIIYLLCGYNLYLHEYLLILLYDYIDKIILMCFNLLIYKLNQKLFLFIILFIYIICTLFDENIIIIITNTIFSINFYNNLYFLMVIPLLIIVIIIYKKNLYNLFIRSD